MNHFQWIFFPCVWQIEHMDITYIQVKLMTIILLKQSYPGFTFTSTITSTITIGHTCDGRNISCMVAGKQFCRTYYHFLKLKQPACNYLKWSWAQSTQDCKHALTNIIRVQSVIASCYRILDCKHALTNIIRVQSVIASCYRILDCKHALSKVGKVQTTLSL